MIVSGKGDVGSSQQAPETIKHRSGMVLDRAHGSAVDKVQQPHQERPTSLIMDGLNVAAVERELGSRKHAQGRIDSGTQMQHRLVLEIELLCCSSGQGLNQSIERSSNAQSSEGECCIETLVGACVGNLEHERRIRGIQRLETPVLVIVARERRDAIVTRQTELENCVFECLVAREAWCSIDRSHVFGSRMNGWMDGWMDEGQEQQQRMSWSTYIYSICSTGNLLPSSRCARSCNRLCVHLLLLVSLLSRARFCSSVLSCATLVDGCTCAPVYVPPVRLFAHLSSVCSVHSSFSWPPVDLLKRSGLPEDNLVPTRLTLAYLGAIRAHASTHIRTAKRHHTCRV